MEIVIATAQLALGTYFLAVMVAGYNKKELNKVERVLLVAALCLIAPEPVSSVVGVILGLAVLLVNAKGAKKAVAT